jgi:hypothetical protein
MARLALRKICLNGNPDQPGRFIWQLVGVLDT